MNNFKDYHLDEQVQKALDKMGYVAPTKVQKAVMQPLFERSDVVVKSKTGSGKTASFGIPIVQSIDWMEQNPKALILTPTRELAMQVRDELQNIALYKRLHVIALYGKSPITQQMKAMKQRTQIVVGTPGRVLDHLERGTLSLDEVEFFVLDEADEMLKMGFIDQVEEIKSYLTQKPTIALFSATLPERIQTLKDEMVENAVLIEMEDQQVQTLHHQYVVARDKMDALLRILSDEKIQNTIVFANTQDEVERVYEELLDEGVLVERIHGGLLQKERSEYLEKFRDGDTRVLVATDVASRGIDVSKVSLIVHYEFPMNNESYIHRSGRSARNGEEGTAVSILRSKEVERLSQLKEVYPISFEEVDLVNYIDLEHLKVGIANDNKKKKFRAEAVFTLYFNAGKNKKIRAKDLLGSIMEVSNVSFEDIGRIEIKDNTSYVEVLHGKGEMLLKEMKNKTIKGKSLKVEKAKG